jgi:hypothetical protein
MTYFSLLLSFVLRRIVDYIFDLPKNEWFLVKVGLLLEVVLNLLVEFRKGDRD